MRVHIVGKNEDSHVDAISWALQKVGVDVSIWNTISNYNLFSLDFNLDRLTVEMGGYSLDDEDTIWIRRVTPPEPSSAIHNSDVNFVIEESSFALQELLNQLSDNYRCINEYVPQTKSKNKFFQMIEAEKLGLNIPRSILSNKPEELKSFVESQKGRTIFKTLSPHSWIDKETGKISRAQASLLPDLDDFSQFFSSDCPVFLQEYIDKAYDTRLIVIGDAVIGVRFLQKQSEKAMIDWRPYVFKGNANIEEIKVPSDIGLAAKRLVKRLGISFASLDFSVDKKGVWNFLEVNPTGQFLWIEQLEPKIPILRIFCQYLLNGSDLSKSTISMRNWAAEKKSHSLKSKDGPKDNRFLNSE